MTEAATLTPLVVIEKVAVVAPAGTVTLGGTVAAALLLDSATVAPPAGAAPPKVTVPVEPLPPTSVAGLTVRLESTGGLMVSVAVRVPLRLPVIVAVVTASTALVVTVNVAVVAPAATVTLTGVLEDVLSSDNVTTEPPAGAAPLRVTVPVEEVPPVTVTGLIVKFERVGALIVRAAVFVTPARIPETVTLVLVPTATVVTLNVAEVVPAATVTLAGVVADALSSDRVTTAPPAGAVLVRVTVPVEELPPVTLAGLIVTLES